MSANLVTSQYLCFVRVMVFFPALSCPTRDVVPGPTTGPAATVSVPLSLGYGPSVPVMSLNYSLHLAAEVVHFCLARKRQSCPFLRRQKSRRVALRVPGLQQLPPKPLAACESGSKGFLVFALLFIFILYHLLLLLPVNATAGRRPTRF